MKTGLLFFSAAALLATSLAARADRNPDFDNDAKPILRMQPHLIEYVRHNFDVRDIGVARVPGDEDRPPVPPFIFQARPRGTSGPYFITLLIQPGPPGRILKVVDSSQLHGRPPGMIGSSGPAHATIPPQEEEPMATAPAQKPAASATPSSSAPTGPTSATPSGPITSDNNSTNPQSLAPPPDPAPTAQ